ncbi:MAG: FtsX-like permease family protein, partial [bacterium]|nr:FtsX-like permease family protein [bacterium]
AIGMACCILILIYVNDEMSYDNYHVKGDRIHRILSFSTIGGTTRHFSMAPPALAQEAANTIPEVESFVRIFNRWDEARFRVGDNTIQDTGFLLADSTFFEIFSYEFISGSPESALNEPNSIVITEEAGRRLFGDEDPLGKTIFVEHLGRQNAAITGIIREIPKNSHLKFNYVMSLINNRGAPPFLSESYYFFGHAYLLLKENAQISEVEKKIETAVEERWGDMLRQRGVAREYPLQKLRDIYLRSNYEADVGEMGNITYVYLFSAIAILVLIIACMNFINLSTARSAKRAREVGLRKVFGAFKIQLVKQFLSESIALSLIGLFLGLILVYLVLPVFNGLTGKEFTIFNLKSSAVMFGLAGIILLTGIISGSFPAFILSRFNPVIVLKGKIIGRSKNISLRKVLVLFQFSISIFMIVSILVILKQVDYLKNKNLGFNREQLIIVDSGGGNRNEALINKLQSNPNVISVTMGNSVPGSLTGDNTYHPEGTDQGVTFRASALYVDYDFTDAYEMEMVMGRNFSREFLTDSANAVIINEKALENIGWEDSPIGKQIFNVGEDNIQRTIIGVVKDFHHKSLQQEINPTVLIPSLGFYRYVSVRINTENISETIGFLENTFKEINPDAEFNYSFIDDDFKNKYQAEERVRKIYVYFGILAIAIACLGLYGLASFTAEERTKEIGIRKTLGANISTIVKNLTAEFIVIVLASNLLAWPVASFIMNTWLDNFAYSTDMGIYIFLISGLIALIIAVLTVSYQAVKAARSNPVVSLRHD